ncbi:hypothetical protein T05_15369, partial [Trichinella murrelli]
LPKEQGRVCTLPCLREGSFTLQDGAHFWSLHPPPALNISSPTPGMFAISQSSFIPDVYLIVVVALFLVYIKRKTFFFLFINLLVLRALIFISPFYLFCCFCSYKLFNIAGWQLVMANMIFPYQLILHDLHRYELTQHWPFVTSVNMVTYFIHCVFVMKNLSRSTSANRIFSNVSILTSVDQQTIRSNLSTIRSLARGLLHFSSFFSMCITVYYVFTYLYAMLSMCQSFYKVKVKVKKSEKKYLEK